MNDLTSESETQDSLSVIADALERGASGEIRDHARALHPAEIAAVLESFPIDERDQVWQLLERDTRADVLAELEHGVRTQRMEQMAPAELAAIARDVDEDDAVDILQDLPEALIG